MADLPEGAWPVQGLIHPGRPDESIYFGDAPPGEKQPPPPGWGYSPGDTLIGPADSPYAGERVKLVDVDDKLYLVPLEPSGGLTSDDFDGGVGAAWAVLVGTLGKLAPANLARSKRSRLRIRTLGQR